MKFPPRAPLLVYTLLGVIEDSPFRPLFFANKFIDPSDLSLEVARPPKGKLNFGFDDLRLDVSSPSILIQFFVTFIFQKLYV